MLESALAQPFQAFGGRDLYEGEIAKACRLAYGIVRNHPFIDGNKRTGAALLGTYLRTRGIPFSPKPDDLLAAVLGIADGSTSFEELCEWVESVAGTS